MEINQFNRSINYWTAVFLKYKSKVCHSCALSNLNVSVLYSCVLFIFLNIPFSYILKHFFVAFYFLNILSPLLFYLCTIFKLSFTLVNLLLFIFSFLKHFLLCCIFFSLILKIKKAKQFLPFKCYFFNKIIFFAFLSFYIHLFIYLKKTYIKFLCKPGQDFFQDDFKVTNI